MGMKTRIGVDQTPWQATRQAIVRCNNVMVVLLLAGHLCADEKAEPLTQDSEKPTLRAVLDDSIGWYELFASDDPKRPMKPVVALRWGNQTRGVADGMTVLWIHKGRPEAVAAVYPWGGDICHWFTSMTRGEIVAHEAGKLIWHPTEAKPQFHPIPDAPEPAETPAARLRQMKLLAGQFSSYMLGWEPDDSDREKLRMLPGPLYRYESEDPELLDGIVYAFVQGTDPESLLVLEAVKAKEGFRWEYAFVRRTSGAIDGRFRDSIVWTAGKNPPEKDPSGDCLAIVRSAVWQE